LKDDDIIPGFKFVRMIYLGAEAELIHGIWASKDVVVKRRISKGYRMKELDLRIIWSRTLKETSLMHDAKKIGVLTPTVYHLNPKMGIIVMSFENFPTLRNTMLEGKEVDLKALGRTIGTLHAAGLVHGDLTPSNILLSPGGPILLDFGLGERTKEEEMFAEDLYLLKRSLDELLDGHAETAFRKILEGYSVGFVAKHEKIKAKIEEISKRGRYIRRGVHHV
jgi:N6-L-threonylcarbamoyladenine synthase/protein kinase Bud32